MLPHIVENQITEISQVGVVAIFIVPARSHWYNLLPSVGPVCQLVEYGSPLCTCVSSVIGGRHTGVSITHALYRSFVACLSSGHTSFMIIASNNCSDTWSGHFTLNTSGTISRMENSRVVADEPNTEGDSAAKSRTRGIWLC